MKNEVDTHIVSTRTHVKSLRWVYLF